jgi:hypothetical protein
MDEWALFERLDKIIGLIEAANKPPSLYYRVINGVATGAGILGILSAIDIIQYPAASIWVLCSPDVVALRSLIPF